MTKEDLDTNPRISLVNGVLLTDDQLARFKEVFDRFDEDGSGNVSSQEVSKIMESLGYEVSTEVLDAVMKEIDFDGSGEISYDEFCSLMAKMLGPDGDLDIDRFLKNVSEAAVREAKQNQIVEAFPGVQEEV